ncbi:SLAM family member 9-like [Clarias gariepinus]|uniref:SLAM family member 9-like n=1 Tax=Clarias gariepinus TaxID=13013 RepID=UPI00234C831C|nr:SLAM family member 9-like [Clarias gariepinus]
MTVHECTKQESLSLLFLTVCNPVFKLVNSSIQLDISTKIVNDDLTWLFNQKENIVKYSVRLRVLGRFKGRVKFDEETHSLTLYNIQKTDSGLYQAEYAGEKREIVATHQIHVLDPVGKTFLNVSHQQSTDTCNVTLICGAQNLSLTSHCYNDTCDMKEQKTVGDAFLSLSLYISNNTIVCNHSNPVSWKTTTMEMKYVKQLCLSEGVSMHTYCMGEM